MWWCCPHPRSHPQATHNKWLSSRFLASPNANRRFGTRLYANYWICVKYILPNLFVQHPKRGQQQEYAEDATKRRPGHLYGVHRADVSTDQQAQAQQQRIRDVEMAVLVVFVRTEDSDRRQQRAERGAHREMLIEAKYQHEHRDDQDASADADESAEYARGKPECKNDYDFTHCQLPPHAQRFRERIRTPARD